MWPATVQFHYTSADHIHLVTFTGHIIAEPRERKQSGSVIYCTSLPTLLQVLLLNNGNRTEWSPIRSVIIRVIMKFVNHEYDYRPTSDDKKSHYQLIISITISDCKCSITCKRPINALIGGGGFIDQSDSRKL